MQRRAEVDETLADSRQRSRATSVRAGLLNNDMSASRALDGSQSPAKPTQHGSGTRLTSNSQPHYVEAAVRRCIQSQANDWVKAVSVDDIADLIN